MLFRSELRAAGVTIILTTHYIEEAEEMADRIGVINKGELILTERKADLMRKLGEKQLVIELNERIGEIPAALAAHTLALSPEGDELTYTYDPDNKDGVASLLDDLKKAGLHLKDLRTTQRSLEDIFVSLVHQEGARA